MVTLSKEELKVKIVPIDLTPPSPEPLKNQLKIDSISVFASYHNPNISKFLNSREFMPSESGYPNPGNASLDNSVYLGTSDHCDSKLFEQFKAWKAQLKAKSPSLYNALDGCGKQFGKYKCDCGHEYKAVTRHCDNRFCLPCAIRRQGRMFFRFKNSVENLFAQSKAGIDIIKKKRPPKGSPKGTPWTTQIIHKSTSLKFLTLTIENISFVNNDWFKQLLKVWNRFCHRKVFKHTIGGIRAIEISIDNQNRFHIHFHVIFAGSFILQKEISEQWDLLCMKELGIRAYITDIREVLNSRHGKNPSVDDCLHEIIKYVFKPGSGKRKKIKVKDENGIESEKWIASGKSIYELPVEKSLALLKAIKHVKTVQGFGSCFNFDEVELTEDQKQEIKLKQAETSGIVGVRYDPEKFSFQFAESAECPYCGREMHLEKDIRLRCNSTGTGVDIDDSVPFYDSSGPPAAEADFHKVFSVVKFLKPKSN